MLCVHFGRRRVESFDGPCDPVFGGGILAGFSVGIDNIEMGRIDTFTLREHRYVLLVSFRGFQMAPHPHVGCSFESKPLAAVLGCEMVLRESIKPLDGFIILPLPYKRTRDPKQRLRDAGIRRIIGQNLCPMLTSLGKESI